MFLRGVNCRCFGHSGRLGLSSDGESWLSEDLLCSVGPWRLAWIVRHDVQEPDSRLRMEKESTGIKWPSVSDLLSQSFVYGKLECMVFEIFVQT